MTKNDEKQEDEDINESAVEDEVVKLREELAAAIQITQDAEDKFKRALADYQNLQKRTQEERFELISTSNKDLLLRILTVLDTLVMASQHSTDKNLQVSIDHFLDILKSEGVTRIETVGRDFDPMLMEAITAETGKEGKVINEVRAGFMLNDKLLRAAQVTVGQKIKN
jgi:molecular chaperone GrpE